MGVRAAGGHQVQAHHPAAAGRTVAAVFRVEAAALVEAAAAGAGNRYSFTFYS